MTRQDKGKYSLILVFDTRWYQSYFYNCINCIHEKQWFFNSNLDDGSNDEEELNNP